MGQNLKSFEESAQAHGINGYQLIMGGAKSGKQVIGMLLDGYKFDKLSNYARVDADLLFDNIKRVGVAQAYAEHVEGCKSVAKQKVADANGRTIEEQLRNILDQYMTYADGVKHLIPMASVDLVSCFDYLKDLHESNDRNTVKQWVLDMQNWYGKNTAKRKVFEMLNTRQIVTINGYIYTNYCLVSLFKAWFKAQDRKTNDEQAQAWVNQWVDRMQEVAGA